MKYIKTFEYYIDSAGNLKENDKTGYNYCVEIRTSFKPNKNKVKYKPKTQEELDTIINLNDIEAFRKDFLLRTTPDKTEIDNDKTDKKMHIFLDFLDKNKIIYEISTDTFDHDRDFDVIDDNSKIKFIMNISIDELRKLIPIMVERKSYARCNPIIMITDMDAIGSDVYKTRTFLFVEKGKLFRNFDV